MRILFLVYLVKQESYLDGLKKVCDLNFDQVVTFNCRLLGGTEIRFPESISKNMELKQSTEC